MPKGDKLKAAAADLRKQMVAKEESTAKRAENKAKRLEKLKPPKSMGDCVDLLYKLREERLLAAKELDLLASRESTLEEYIIKTFGRNKVDGVRGKIAQASANQVQVPVVKDWDKLYAYITKNKAFEMLHKRISIGAVRERWEAKKAVPGVESIEIVKLSVSKVGSKK